MNNFSLQAVKFGLTRLLGGMGVLFLCCFFLLACDVAVEKKSAQTSTDVRWVIAPEVLDTSKKFDVFYVYPTLNASRRAPLLDFADKASREKVQGFSRAQVSGLVSCANVFVPEVRQLEFYRCIAELNAMDSRAMWSPLPTSQMRMGMMDCQRAFRAFRERTKGRPYILLGHSQGALDLFELVMSDTSIGVENGFVAAYLLGMPLDPACVEKDPLKGRVGLAQNASDTGVLMTWNTEREGASSSVFVRPGFYGINPLNWRTDTTPALPFENLGAMQFTDAQFRFQFEPGFCGAVLNAQTHALHVVDLISSVDDFMTSGCLHTGDLLFFYRNVIQNIKHRVDVYLMNVK